MKRVSAFIICFVLLISYNAFSADDCEEVRNPGQVRHDQVAQDNAGGGRAMTPADGNPRRWTPRARQTFAIVAGVTVLCGIQLLQYYLAARLDKYFCSPHLDPQVFNNYNAYYKTNLTPTGIMEQWGANVQDNPILAVLDNAYQSNKYFLFNLTKTTLTKSHVVCQYSPFDYRSSDQRYLEYSPNYRDISFDLIYNVSHISQGVEVRKKSFNNYIIPFTLLFFLTTLMG